MATLAYPTQAYQSAEAATADPKHLVVLLFDTMVRHLTQARAAMAGGDHQEQCQRVVRTQRILSALLASLDTSVEPEFGTSLFGLYNWLHGRLTEASLSEDQTVLDEVLGIVVQLRDAWRQAEANCQASAA